MHAHIAPGDACKRRGRSQEQRAHVFAAGNHSRQRVCGRRVRWIGRAARREDDVGPRESRAHAVVEHGLDLHLQARRNRAQVAALVFERALVVRPDAEGGIAPSRCNERCSACEQPRTGRG